MSPRKPEHVVAYTRVSRVGGRSGESFPSPKQQAQEIGAWAERTGATIVERVEDLDVSGGTIEQPGFQCGLDLIEADKPTHL